MQSASFHIEKDSSINEQIEQMRLSATKALLEREDSIIVATVSAIYGIGDPVDYHGMILHLRHNEKMAQRDVIKRLVEMQPKHVFSLYKSAEAHTKHKHTLPLAAKALFVLLPLVVFLGYSSYKTISGKFHPEKPVQAEPVKHQPGGKIQQAKMDIPAQSQSQLPDGFESYNVKEIDNHHPFESLQFSIVARLKSATKDVFRFSASENGQHSFYTSSLDLQAAGYVVVPINDCSVKLVYKSLEFFVTCDNSRQPQQPQFQQPLQHMVKGQFESYP